MRSCEAAVMPKAKEQLTRVEKIFSVRPPAQTQGQGPMCLCSFSNLLEMLQMWACTHILWLDFSALSLCSGYKLFSSVGVNLNLWGLCMCFNQIQHSTVNIQLFVLWFYLCGGILKAGGRKLMAVELMAATEIKSSWRIGKLLPWKMDLCMGMHHPARLCTKVCACFAEQAWVMECDKRARASQFWRPILLFCVGNVAGAS